MQHFLKQYKWYLLPPFLVLIVLSAILIFLARGPQTSAFLYEIR